MDGPRCESQDLLAWFDRCRRDLPWRSTSDPYRIWVSETMLQQTQVERVLPYYEQLVSTFSDVDALARAPLEDVLAVWSGLGYYRRARYLHAAARQIVARGGFPRTMAGWLELPGVGPYTAGAVASIAFGERVPAIDGNAARVLSRFAALEDSPSGKTGRRRLTALAESLVDDDRPGDSNQALMELGAVVCRPSQPRCHECPLEASCKGRLQGAAEAYPRRKPSRQVIEERRLGVVVRAGGRVLLFRRPEGASLLAGLWEIPWIAWCARDNAARELRSRYGGNWDLDRSCGWVRHSITHRDIRFEVWTGRLTSGCHIAENPEAGWYTETEVGGLAVSSLVDKVMRCAAD
ncbi:MAG: A/G-specific adenine glycosylase [Acidobacteriota bacterium]|nr:A/G-specific adenine glycosylase [Acidobacteriota bacterium]